MSLLHVPKGRWTFATVGTIVRASKRMNCSALWRSSIGAILFSAWILLHSRQGTIAQLEASLARESARLLQTESTLKEYLQCVAALENVLVGPHQGKGNTARISTLISTVEELQAEARTARASSDEIRRMKHLLQEYETLESGLNDQIISLSRKVEELEADKTQRISEETTGLKGQLQLSEIRLAEKDAHILGLASAIEQHKLTDSRREVEQEKEVSSLKAKIQVLEVEVLETNTLLLKYPSIEELSDDSRIGLCPGLDAPEKPVRAEAAVQTTASIDSLDLLNDTVITQQKEILQKDEVIAKLEARAAEVEYSCREKDRRMCSLSDSSHKQRERVSELESRVNVLTLQISQLENARAHEQDRYDQDNRRLQDSLIAANSIIAKGEDKIKELVADADAKEKDIRALAQAKHLAVVASAGMDEQRTSVLCTTTTTTTTTNLTKANPAVKPTKHRKLQKQPPPKEESMPDAQGRAQYEQKIAELTDRLAECFALLKNSGISPSAVTSALWPPPYEAPAPSSNSPGQSSITTCRADEFSGANARPLWQRVRSSAPEASQ